MSTWLDAVFTVGNGVAGTEKAQCPSVTVQIPHNYRQVHKVVLQGVKSESVRTQADYDAGTLNLAKVVADVPEPGEPMSMHPETTVKSLPVASQPAKLCLIWINRLDSDTLWGPELRGLEPFAVVPLGDHYGDGPFAAARMAEQGQVQRQLKVTARYFDPGADTTSENAPTSNLNPVLEGVRATIWLRILVSP